MKHPAYGFSLALLGLLGAMHSAHANDSVGWVSTGGVQYLKSDEIRMVSEDLFISVDKIHVDYEFHNDATTDVTETVLFPLPAAATDVDGDFANVKALHQSFKIWVNGQSVKPTQHVRALWRDTSKASIDITEALRTECHLNDAQIADPASLLRNGNEDHVIQPCLAQLAKARIISSLPIDQPVWDSQIIYSWQQTFPAKQSIRVRHEYVPLIGGSLAGISRSDEEYARDMQKTYCFDETFWQKMTRSQRIYPSYEALGYILTTGANWAKPIERFHLTIEKPKDTLMSLCWDRSLKKVSDTRFEAYKTNFTPTRDIDIIFAIPALKDQGNWQP